MVTKILDIEDSLEYIGKYVIFPYHEFKGTIGEITTHLPEYNLYEVVFKIRPRAMKMTCSIEMFNDCANAHIGTLEEMEAIDKQHIVIVK